MDQDVTKLFKPGVNQIITEWNPTTYLGIP